MAGPADNFQGETEFLTKSATKMKDKDKPNDGAAPEKAAAVRVKDLRHGLQIAGGTAARGAVVNVTAADAEAFEKRGDVVFIGTV